MNETFYVYIIKCKVTGILYKGVTTDFERRLNDHNSGRSAFTKSGGPWTIVYLEAHSSKKEALIRERKLKRCNRTYLEWLISQPSNLLRK